MRHQRLVKVLGICAAILPWSGCATTPSPPFPQQQYQGVPYQYQAQPGQPIQASPMVGVMPPGQPTMMPQGQIPTYPVMQQGAVPGYPAGYTAQPMVQQQPPMIGR
ncbi:MAG: hypothetical protein WCK15_06685 [Pirellula sp.]